MIACKNKLKNIQNIFSLSYPQIFVVCFSERKKKSPITFAGSSARPAVH